MPLHFSVKIMTTKIPTRDSDEIIKKANTHTPMKNDSDHDLSFVSCTYSIYTKLNLIFYCAYK